MLKKYRSAKNRKEIPEDNLFNLSFCESIKNYGRISKSKILPFHHETEIAGWS